MVTTNFGGVGAIAGCHRSVLGLGGGIFLSTLITQKFVVAIWGLCWYSFIFHFDSTSTLVVFGKR